MKRGFIFSVIIIFPFFLFAQIKPAQFACKNEIFNNKVNELYTKYYKEGFKTYKGSTINVENKTEYPIFMELYEGRWYHFIIIGEPNAKRIEVNLALEEVGTIVSDRFYPIKSGEYWTTFSFICKATGRYLLTVFEKGESNNLCMHVGVLQKQNATQSGKYIIK